MSKIGSIFDEVKQMHPELSHMADALLPGGLFLTLPDSDHLFHTFSTEQESMQNFQEGQFNHAFTKLLKGWIEEAMRGS
jgi:hypothetical protein